MTRKLFYEDSYMKSCRAAVLECRQNKNRFEILLDQTCFFPEGGGQPGDTGMLIPCAVSDCGAQDTSAPDAGDGSSSGAESEGRGSSSGAESAGIAVFDTHEKDGLVFHYTEKPLPEGTEVTAVIDWERRFDLMQQHSGEHMLSGVIHRRWGYDNVGFHLGTDRVTIDLSGTLSFDQLLDAENEVNRRIWEDEQVKIWFPSAEELPRIPYRSKKELDGDVRIVEFPGADICACCGTHVKHTGAIGLVKVISCEKWRDGIRVELLCGGRAVRYLGHILEQNRLVSQQLSAKPLETSGAVANIAAELNEKRQRIYALEEASFAAAAEKYAGAGNVLVFLNDLDPDGVRRACDAIQKTCGGLSAVFSGSDADGYRYALGLPGGDLRETTRSLNAALNGRGGGKPFFTQGNVKASKAQIGDFFREML